MNVGCCSIRFYLHGNGSLKGKRRIVRAIKDRIKNKFNISVAEVGDQDSWKNLHLGIVAVNADARYLEGQLQQVVHFIDNMHLAEMTQHEIQLIRMGENPF